MHLISYGELIIDFNWNEKNRNCWFIYKHTELQCIWRCKFNEALKAICKYGGSDLMVWGIFCFISELSETIVFTYFSLHNGWWTAVFSAFDEQMFCWSELTHALMHSAAFYFIGLCSDFFYGIVKRWNPSHVIYLIQNKL